MRKYFLIGFVTLFLIIPNQIIAQSNDTTTYYDVTEQLDYVSFTIKLEPGLFTKYGRLHHRRMTEEGPDKETVTIEVGGVLRGINGIPPTLDKYQLSAEKRILKNGQIHELKIHKRTKMIKDYYEKRAKEFKENEEKMKKLMEEQARMKKLKEKQGKNK